MPTKLLVSAPEVVGSPQAQRLTLQQVLTQPKASGEETTQTCPQARYAVSGQDLSLEPPAWRGREAKRPTHGEGLPKSPRADDWLGTWGQAS